MEENILICEDSQESIFTAIYRAYEKHYQPEKTMIHTNEYTYEDVIEIADFTEEDKQLILDMIQNSYCAKILNANDMYVIIFEEVDYFFKGTKSAEDTAAVIQNRMSLYLME